MFKGTIIDLLCIRQLIILKQTYTCIVTGFLPCNEVNRKVNSLH